MATTLYHFEVGIPEWVYEQICGASYWFQWSQHAKHACRTDRYGIIIPPRNVTVMRENVVEVEVSDATKEVVKVVYRQQLDDRRDVVMAFIPNDDGTALMKTVWCNLRSDKHTTLRREAYAHA